MTAVLSWLAAATLLFFASFLLLLLKGRKEYRLLSEVSPAFEGPPVSVIVAARNEEKNIEEALSSLLSQDYPHLQLIVVNDRSTDATGEILARMALMHPALRLVEVTDLSPGWLGKNHALQVGAERASGELLLFTDADVVMDVTAISRAVGYLQSSEADHLAIGPEITMHGWLLNSVAAAFMIFFSLYARPWKVRDPKSSAHIGVGAFNMLRREVYRAIGGHRAIPLRPDDDMMLGKLVKKGGFRQEMLIGRGMLRVEWYRSLPDMVRGLEKNSYAAVDYNPFLLAAGSLFIFIAFVWPLPALFFLKGWGLAADCAALASLAAMILLNSRLFGGKARYGLLLPVASLIFIFILWRSALVIHLRGMEWRGTRYSLDELRRSRK